MSRKPNQMTVAIRAICEKYDFSINYSAARSELEAMGVPIAPEPPEPSEHYLVWSATDHLFKFPKKNDDQLIREYYENTCESAGLMDHIDSIQKEDTVVRRYNNERNLFDVVKSQFKKKLLGEEEVVDSPNQSEINEHLSFVITNGGKQSVLSMLIDKETQLTGLTEEVNFLRKVLKTMDYVSHALDSRKS